MTNTTQIEVTQADRDAAANHADWFAAKPGTDGYNLAEAFARHRLAHSTPASELEEALSKIASYPHGGVTVEGECSGDRSEMILLARTALRKYRARQALGETKP